MCMPGSRKPGPFLKYYAILGNYIARRGNDQPRTRGDFVISVDFGSATPRHNSHQRIAQTRSRRLANPITTKVEGATQFDGV